MIRVTYHDDLKEVQADGPLAGLLGDGEALAPFDRLAWWRNLTESCDILPLIAVARSADQRAVLALMRRKRSIFALANWYSFRVKPLFTKGASQAELLTELAADLAGQAPHIVLEPLPNEHGETDLTAACFRKSGWLVFREQSDVNHVLHVRGRSFAEYLAGRPGPLRTTLKRKSGKVAVQLLDRFDADAWAAYEAVYAQSWKPEEGSPKFLRRFVEEEGAAGRLRMAIARHDGEPVAAQFWTVEGGTAFIHKLAHTEASKSLSPGTTLSAALFEWVIDRDKVTLIDFGTGNDGYKRDWMEDVRPRYRLTMFRPAWPQNWPAIARIALRRLAGGAKHG
ncbi:GNAT family N-acetyltransferase [Novosphingobium sp. MW5]|nr:GNAT family N-acetyltransferase [Novosphingobium sp. MW5]